MIQGLGVLKLKMSLFSLSFIKVLCAGNQEFVVSVVVYKSGECSKPIVV